MGTDVITTVYAGDVLNRRPQKSIIIKALEDNSNWCYSLHFDSLFTTNDAEGINWESLTTPRVINGEQIKISAGETITIVDDDKDIYIANPIYDSEPNTISHKSLEKDSFTSLNFGKYLKIGQGKPFELQSTIDTYIPKIYYVNL
jgi:hypothetical protein